MSRPQDNVDRDLARVLLAHRPQVAEVFASSLRQTSRWPRQLDDAQADWDNFLRDHFFAWVDYLARYFADGDDTFRQLFVGEKIKALYDATLDDAQRKAQAR